MSWCARNPDATAFGDRSQPWLFSIDAIWSKREDGVANIAWGRRLWSAMRPYSNGRLYLNFLSSSEDDPQVVLDRAVDETAEIPDGHRWDARPQSQVRTSLFAGGSRIRTLGPANAAIAAVAA
jgi:hypothetical protein